MNAEQNAELVEFLNPVGLFVLVWILSKQVNEVDGREHQQKLNLEEGKVSQ